jgi:hypothetical protein
MIALLALALSGPCQVRANGTSSDWYERAEAYTSSLRVGRSWA